MAPIKKINNVSDIQNIRLKFGSSYETDNMDDENSHHDYDITINLKYYFKAFT